jgi:hypothetical protein
VTPKPEVEPSIEPSTTEALSGADEIEAGIKLAVRRIADLQEKGSGFRSSRGGFEFGTEKRVRADRADTIAKARSEGWSSEQLADELQPPPYVEYVAKGASQLIYRNGNYYKPCWCNGSDPECMYCAGSGEMFDSDGGMGERIVLPGETS